MTTPSPFGRRFYRVRITHEWLCEAGFPRMPDGVLLVAGHYRPEHGDWDLTLAHPSWREIGEAESPPLASVFVYPARTVIEL
jgi:hypothetical protein